eukprot:jgi/Botrbrau1/18323/Bobra.0179s0051.1
MSFNRRGKTAQQLIEDGIAPVKAEHWREAGRRVLVQAITSNAEPAENKKSKRQIKKERKEKAATDLCFSYAVGSCHYGERCKFSHDVAAYVAARPPDLPGSCPNSCLPSCPFGITCRWASSHTRPDDLTKQFLIRTAATEAPGPDPVASGTAPLNFPGGGTVPGDPTVQETADASRSAASVVVPGSTAGGNNAAGLTVGEGVLPLPDEESGLLAVEGARGSADLNSNGCRLNGNVSPQQDSSPDGSGLHGRRSVAFLQPQQDTRAVVNQLDKSVQGRLRRGCYDFSKASAVLAGMGVKSGKNQQSMPAVQQKGCEPSSAKGATHGPEQQVIPPERHPDQATGGAAGLAGVPGPPANGERPEQAPADWLPDLDRGGSSPAHEEACRRQDGSSCDPEGPKAKRIRADAGVILPSAPETHRPGNEGGRTVSAAGNGLLPGDRNGDLQMAETEIAVSGRDEDLPMAEAGSLVEPKEIAPPVANGFAKEDGVLLTAESQSGAPFGIEDVLMTETGIGTTGKTLAEPGMANGSAVTPESCSGMKLFDLEANANVDVEVRVRAAEHRKVDFREKLYLAPLTTVGNLPFRRVCKRLGADITCGEMAMATNLLQGQASEWALLKRHPCEEIFGVQVCGGYVDAMTKCAQLLEDQTDVDFVDINFGCPIDCVTRRNAGSACLTRPNRIEAIARGMSSVLSCDLTMKVRKGFNDGADIVHTWLPRAPSWGVSAVVLHGRTRQQRYTKLADWQYIKATSESCPGLQLIGNGDVLSQQEYYERLEECPRLATAMIARAALIKPWIFTEIKERRDWDISAGERFDLLKLFCSSGLMHWGSDARGVETTRRFLLEWLSFLHRYVPVGLLEIVPQKMNWRPPPFVGRSDLETLLGSDNAADWVRISEMLLGPAPHGFVFAPKHKSSSYAASEAGMAHEAEQENG